MSINDAYESPILAPSDFYQLSKIYSRKLFISYKKSRISFLLAD